MERKSLFVACLVMLVFGVAYGVLEVKGSTMSNLAKISHHEQYLATEAEAQVKLLENKLEQRRESLRIIQRNPEQYLNSDLLIRKFHEDILAIENSIKELQAR
jgi:hypothetical protein